MLYDNAVKMIFFGGGYLVNFVLGLGNQNYPYPMENNDILFIEESEKYILHSHI